MRLKAVIFGALAFASGWFGHQTTSATAAPQERNPYAMVGQLGRVLALIENEYVDPVDRRRLVEGAIKGMVHELDPHSNYLPPEDFATDRNNLEGQFGGIGIEVDIRGDVLTVLATIEGSPAEQGGLKAGDQIVAVNGEDVRSIGLDKMTRRLRGPAGSHVKVTIHRDGQKELVTIDLVRAIIKMASVEQKMLDGGIAYLRIKQFQEHTHEEMLRAIGKLRSVGAVKGVVVDLRTNPGGLVDQACEVADEFLDSGNIYSARHRGVITDKVDARGGGALVDVPVAVLVNGYSASASELVSGALQDHKRAVIVGDRTFGKGIVQTVLDLPEGAGLYLTTARYYSPNGHAIQGDGIHPDVQIDNSKITKSTLPQLREKDLENSIPSEGMPGGDAGVTYVAPAIDGGAADEQTSIRNMPSDPAKGTDFVLKVGYEIVKKSIK